MLYEVITVVGDGGRGITRADAGLDCGKCIAGTDLRIECFERLQQCVIIDRNGVGTSASAVGDRNSRADRNGGVVRASAGSAGTEISQIKYEVAAGVIGA